MRQDAILLTDIRENENNPRTITSENLEKLKDSLLVFPKMLGIRQIVINADNVVLGGNMRFKALTAIFNMPDEEINERIEKHAHKRNLDEITRKERAEQWIAWKANPYVDVLYAELDQDETEQFVIKDNVSSGDWDMDALENFDPDDLEEFGVQTWGNLDNLMDFDSPEQERQRIIITYPVGRETEMAQLLGLADLSKPNYKIEELKK